MFHSPKNTNPAPYTFGRLAKPQIFDLVSYTFGSIKASVSKGEYRYGMNTQEKDNEIYGEGNSYTAEYWQYDARLGRRWNVDPVVKEWESGYATFHNNPIICVDIKGDDPTTNNKKGDRSMKKYERKYNKAAEEISKANPEKSQEQINTEAHKKVEDNYNHKKWMWVKNQGEGNGSGYNEYFHAGDLFVKNNPDKDVTINRTTQTTQILSEGGPIFGFADQAGNLIGGRTYILPASGSVSFSFVSTEGTWTYNARQGQGTIRNSNDLNSLPSVTGDLNVNPSNSPLIGQIDLNINNGTRLFVSYIAPRGVSQSQGGLTPSNVTLSLNTTTTLSMQQSSLVKAYGIPRVEGGTNGKLNEKGIKYINENRDREVYGKLK